MISYMIFSNAPGWGVKRKGKRRVKRRVMIFKTFIAPSHLSRGDQAVTAHTSSVPAPPYPIRAEGPDLWYQMQLEDTYYDITYEIYDIIVFNDIIIFMIS